MGVKSSLNRRNSLMYKKTLFSSFLVLGLAVLLPGCFSFVQEIPREPIIFSGENSSLPAMDINLLILESHFIAIGRFDSIPPSQWNTPNGQLPENATLQTVWEQDLFIYTEQIFQPEEILKIDPQEREVLVRSFGGQVGEDVMEISSLDVIYTPEQEYLLFLSYYPDRVQDDTPGYYLASGSIQGVYKIVDGMAISYNDEWPLDELVTYIQDSKLSKVDVPDTPEALEIIHQVNTALEIEFECIFDYSRLSSVYVNDLRYPVDDEKLEFIRIVTDNPFLASAGYLDYKTAYYPWWLEGKRQWEEIYSKAQAENRDVSEEERNAFLLSKWGEYPGGACNPVGKIEAIIVSILIEDDIATVVYGIGSRAKEATLALIDGYWLIAQEKDI